MKTTECIGIRTRCKDFIGFSLWFVKLQFQLNWAFMLNCLN